MLHTYVLKLNFKGFIFMYIFPEIKYLNTDSVMLYMYSFQQYLSWIDALYIKFVFF